MTINAGLKQRFEVEPLLDSIAIIQTAIDRAATGVLDKRRLFQLNMAVEELMTNVVRHSGTSAAVEVLIQQQPDAFHVELADQGPPFDPFSQAPKPALEAGLEERPIGGLGVHLVQKMLDKVEYRREGGRNLVTLTMNLHGSEHQA